MVYILCIKIYTVITPSSIEGMNHDFKNMEASLVDDQNGT